jgi:hypothetical protein
MSSKALAANDGGEMTRRARKIAAAFYGRIAIRWCAAGA